jgi:hypothetical protein
MCIDRTLINVPPCWLDCWLGAAMTLTAFKPMHETKHGLLPCVAAGMELMARLTFNMMDYNEFFGQTHSLGLGTATLAGTALFWMSVILLQVIHVPDQYVTVASVTPPLCACEPNVASGVGRVAGALC